MKVCQMCGIRTERLARCHIVPDAMTRYLANENNKLVHMSTRFGPRAGSGRGGMYDDSIVCDSCERSFFRADDYAIGFWKRLLSRTLPFDLPFGTGKLRQYKVSSELLHTFCMQTLLRSFYSSRWEHDQVELKGVERALSDKLRRGDSTIVDGPEIAFEFINDDKAANVMTPYVAISGDHRIYQLSFPHLVASVAMEDALPSWFGPAVMRPGEPVTVWHRKRLHRLELEIVDGFYGPNRSRITKIMG